MDALDERFPWLEADRFDEVLGLDDEPRFDDEPRLEDELRPEDEPRPDDEPSLVEDRLALDDERLLSRPLLLLLWPEPRAPPLDALPRPLVVELPRELCDFDRELAPLELF